MEKGGILAFALIIFFIGFVSASVIEDTLHLNIQTTYSNGSIQTGTFAFVFNISTAPDCNAANVIYTNSTSLTTDSRGIVSYYLENLSLSFSEQYWLCYYRDGTLINSTRFSRVPYVYRANISDNLNATINYQMANLTLSSLMTFGLLETIDNLVDGWIRVNGNLNVTNNLTVGGNVTALYFFGDGSQLTNLPSSGISGSGTSGYIPVWNSTSSINNSNIFQLGNNIGIGTASPTSRLTIAETDTSSPYALSITRTTSSGDYLAMANFGTIGGNKFSQLSTGHTALTTWANYDISQNRWEAEATTTVGATQILFNNSGSIQFNTNASSSKSVGDPLIYNTPLYLGADGLVGIGTTSPDYLLDMQLASGQTIPLRMATNDFNGVNTGSDLEFNFGASSGNTYSRISALSAGGGAWNNLVLQTGGGNVGIGTTSPAAKLQIDSIDVHLKLNETDTNKAWHLEVSNGLLRFVETGLSVPLVIQNITGNVGIGTTSPATKLEVAGTGAVRLNGSAPQIQFNDSNNRIFWNDSGMYFTGGGTDRIFINSSSGNVGIGTTSPSSKLHILGNSSAGDEILASLFKTNTEATNSTIAIGRSSLRYASISAIGSSSANGNKNDLAFSTNLAGADTPTERMRILSSGEIGIGTTTPNHQVEIYHATAGTLSIHSNRETAGDLASIFLSTVNSATTRRKGAIFFRASGAGDGRGDIIFANDNAADSGSAGVGDAVMTLNSSGNVGIGTTAPTRTLQLFGSADSFLKFTNTDTGSLITDGVEIGIDSSENLELINRETGNIHFTTGGQERATILTGGNVGIGFATPTTKLEIFQSDTTALYPLYVRKNLSSADYNAIARFGQNGLTVQQFSNGESALTNWVRWDLTDNRWEADSTTTVGATQVLFDNDGFIQFNTNASSARTAGDLITWNTPLYLGATGNVGIGTTNPQDALDVIGYVNSSIGFKVNSSTGFTGSGTSCTITAIKGGIITAATCT